MENDEEFLLIKYEKYIKKIVHRFKVSPYDEDDLYQAGLMGFIQAIRHYDKNKNVKLTFTVKNTGKKAGAETVQVYVAPISHKEDRPDKELKGFEKVTLAPGKSQKVSISLHQQDFAYFDVHVHDFVADTGDYEILVGASSGDIRLKGIVTLE